MSRLYEGWVDGIPPATWKRIMTMDVGGATPNNLEWFAQDPESMSLVAYDEVNMTTTSMRDIAERALPKMKHPSGAEYDYIAKAGDYENRVALDDMGRHGITFTNAVKHNKILSIHRLAGYLHDNPKRPFPVWHPRAGQFGAPLLFITLACKHLIRELPQQKWKSERIGDSIKDEMDRSVIHDAVDCALYATRILPAPATIPIPKIAIENDTRSLQSRLYWEDVRREKERKMAAETRKKYNPSHGGGRNWSSLLGF